eukprot:403335918
MINAVLLGDPRVGKTSLIQRHVDKIYDDRQNSTVDSSFKQSSGVVRDIDYNIKFWDTAGQERYRQLIVVFARNKNCIVFVFDLTDLSSFLIIESHFIKMIRMLYGKLDMPLFLVGNKCDMSTRQVQQEDIQKLVEKYNLIYFETSCKENINIDDLFESIKIKSIDYLEKNGEFVMEKQKVNSRFKLKLQTEGQTTEVKTQAQKKRKRRCF